MKQITLINYTNANKKSIYLAERKYTIYLYSERVCGFSMRSDLERFISEVNRSLTKGLHEIIDIYMDVSKAYWSCWFYMDSKDRISNHKMRKIQEEGLSQLEGIPKMLNLMVDRCHYTNGNPFTFSYFEKIMNILDNIASEMINIRKNRKHYSDVYKLEMLQRRIQNLKTEIFSLGEENQTSASRFNTEFSDSNSSN